MEVRNNDEKYEDEENLPYTDSHNNCLRHLRTEKIPHCPCHRSEAEQTYRTADDAIQGKEPIREKKGNRSQRQNDNARLFSDVLNHLWNQFFHCPLPPASLRL